MPDSDTAPYWTAAAQRILSLPQCRACGMILFPPKARCPDCLHEHLEWTVLSGRGTLYSYCVMHMRLIPGFEPPYVVGVVELAEQAGLRITTNLLHCAVETVRIGMPLEVVFEERGEGITAPQFQPVGTGQAPGA
ncbi:MAG TPA: OB-fold domain-containing protein [Caulobacteraceae bacterium]|nr:OB-fold domain-containing protein [Caulobacteraceae bacterium]